MAPSSSSAPAPHQTRSRNPRTLALLRRDSFWQIFLPVGLALAGGVVLGVLVSIPGGAGVRGAWADVSLILLIVPTLLLGLILLVLIVGLAFVAYYGLRELPYLFRIAQDYSALASARVKSGAAKASGWILSIRSFTAGVGRTVKNVRQILRLGG